MEKQKPKYNILQNTAYMMRRYARESPRAVLVIALQALLKVAMPFLGVLLPAAVLEYVARGVQPEKLLAVTLGMVGLLACAAILDKLCDGYIFGRAIHLRLLFVADIMYKQLDADYAVIESPATRELAERGNAFVGDNGSGAEATLRTTRDLAANALGLALYAAYLSRVNAWIFLGIVALSAVSYLAAWIYNRWEYGRRKRMDKIWTRSWYLNQACANFEAGKDIRVYGIEAWFARLGARILGDNAALVRARENRRLASVLVDVLMTLLRSGWAYVYLIMRVAEGAIGVPDFVLAFGVVAGISAWVNGIAQNLVTLNRCSLECCDFRAFVELPDRQNRGAGHPLPTGGELPPAFLLENVKYAYHGADVPALDIPALRIERGQKVAVVGRNGAGKTTFVKLLTGIYAPDAGAVRLNGIDSRAFNRDEYYDLFTAVFQDFYFLPGTIAENVALAMGADVDREKVRQCLQMAGLHDKVLTLKEGIDTPMVRAVNDEATELSGGEKQRLVLARALYKGAPVLVLDEPTAALDPIAESDMYMKYASFAEGHTSIFISHRLASTRFCDRILFIEGGKIVEDGTHGQLMALGGRYKEMFDIQSHYYKEGTGDE